MEYTKKYIIDLLSKKGHNNISKYIDKKKLLQIFSKKEKNLFYQNGYNFCLQTVPQLKKKLRIKNRNYTKTKLISILVNINKQHDKLAFVKRFLILAKN